MKNLLYIPSDEELKSFLYGECSDYLAHGLDSNDIDRIVNSIKTLIVTSFSKIIIEQQGHDTVTDQHTEKEGQ